MSLRLRLVCCVDISSLLCVQRMQSGESPEGSFQVIKLLSRRPSQWEQCVAIGRLKFEKYFKRKVMHNDLKITLWCCCSCI